MVPETVKTYLSSLRRGYPYFVLFCAPLLLNSCTTENSLDVHATVPSASNAGNYLTGRVAYNNHDLNDATSSFRDALKKDPNENLLLRRSFIAELEAGNLDHAIKLAERALKQKKTSIFMHLVIGLRDAKEGSWDKALGNFNKMESSQVNEILKPLLLGWSYLGKKDLPKARQNLLSLKKKRGFELLSLLHTALALQDQEKIPVIDKLLDEAMGSVEETPSRLALTAANYYQKTGRTDTAINLIDKIKSKDFNLEILKGRRRTTKSSSLSEVTVRSPQDGISEALFDIASALRDEYDNNASLIFVRLASYMRPEFHSAQILLGEILEERGKYPEAIKEFEQIPEDSIFFRMAQLRLSQTLRQDDKPRAAIQVLERLKQRQPKNAENFIRLGDIYRSQKDWDEAIFAYNTAINLTNRNSKSDWILYYSRGVALEQSGRWDMAEADFIKALELAPDQPFIMNYLGYAWTEQGMNLKKAEQLIRKAVSLRPKDGYITDSLGWVLYQTSRFDEAVPILERAVRLRPNDATINDHLGDAYWQVQRKLEAIYQWKRAITMNPDSELKEKIQQKLSFGLN
tara:strand:+ start:2706 stop:4424 length:1719 start_codon:yes stop_codon:yes gene_type:complete